MDFSYPDTHNDLKSLAADIFTDFSAPDRLKKLEVDGPYFDRELWLKLKETGVLSAALPESVGGMDMDYSTTTVVAELIGQTVVSVPYIPCIVSVALPLIAVIDDPYVSSALSALANGELILSPALIEPGNEDALQPQTLAREDKHGWSISGAKHCVAYAGDAGQILVSALVKTSSSEELWLGLVDLQQSGVELIEQRCTASEPQYHVNMNDARAHCVATGTAAVGIIQQSTAMTMVAYCSMAVGAAERMTKISCEYTSQREQFGVPIATFQAVAHRLASCYIDTECLRIVTLKAASDVDSNDLESDAIPMAKFWCGDVLHRVSQAAQHVHGGAGIDRDYLLFRYCLWAKQLELSLGCSKKHIETIADRLERKYLSAAIR